MKPIITEVNKLVHRVFKRQHPILAELIVNWGKIVGAKFYEKVTPLKIVTSKEGGKKINILYISAVNSSVSMEVSYQQELIIERIAIYLGYKGVHKIKMLVRG
ncbi:MAG: DUF721 domain-containing protein [Rickettsiaceae bacterium]|nr:DUF721 domain-containing protein [Rickettsiaceae bacterium]